MKLIHNYYVVQYVFLEILLLCLLCHHGDLHSFCCIVQHLICHHAILNEVHLGERLSERAYVKGTTRKLKSFAPSFNDDATFLKAIAFYQCVSELRVRIMANIP